MMAGYQGSSQPVWSSGVWPITQSLCKHDQPMLSGHDLTIRARLMDFACCGRGGRHVIRLRLARHRYWMPSSNADVFNWENARYSAFRPLQCRRVAKHRFSSLSYAWISPASSPAVILALTCCFFVGCMQLLSLQSAPTAFVLARPPSLLVASFVDMPIHFLTTVPAKSLWLVLVAERFYLNFWAQYVWWNSGYV